MTAAAVALTAPNWYVIAANLLPPSRTVSPRGS
jgi:hypothetical protein